ncbi:BQ5605_C006g04051 [Microbotryum silenes-dioicae]|uniref:BQ5605_C006g04051 protein n=1 Tax=Microbotryum silenes-dioicae TaxID=796604 RepID=A0A2X0P889_9BASI|nr:BQ5605_C006g04051 [Microbotryum silenes-dioicae]
MGSVLSSSATVQTQQHHISASSIAEDGRSTTLASRPTTSNSSNSMSHRIEEVQDEIEPSTMPFERCLRLRACHCRKRRPTLR